MAASHCLTALSRKSPEGMEAIDRSARSSKRQRRSYPGLASLLRPSFQARPRDCTICLEALIRIKMGPDGSLWYACYADQRRETTNIWVMLPDGSRELAADNLRGELRCFSPTGSSLLLLNQDSTIIKVKRGVGASVLVESNTGAFVTYKTGILAVPRGEPKSLERRDFNGALLETLHFDFTLPHKEMFAAWHGRELLFLHAQRTQIWKVDLVNRCRTVIVGCDKGCHDGHGTSARFHSLKPLCNDGPGRALVRDVQPMGTRLCRIDLQTYEVTTVDVQGIDWGTVANYSYWFPTLIAVMHDGTMFQADLSNDVTRSTFADDMLQVDWTEYGVAEFQFSDGAIMRPDPRVLRARSEYFAAMLSPEHKFVEACNGRVDLRHSPVDSRAFRAVLTYLATDELDLRVASGPGGASEWDEGAEGMWRHVLFCLEVASLAQQYQLPRLAKLAEAFVLRVALPGRDCLVLPLLEQTFGSGGQVERLCWEAVERRAAAVLAATSTEELEHILVRAPRVGVALLRRVAGAKPPALNESCI